MSTRQHDWRDRLPVPIAEPEQHTPGPSWKVIPAQTFAGRWNVVGQYTDVPICRDVHNEDTARLIAVAPDMLRALHVVCQALARWRDGEDVNLEALKYEVVDRIIEAVEPGFDGGTTTLDEVRTALAKAEGV